MKQKDYSNCYYTTKQKDISYDKLITQDMILPYHMDISYDKSDKELYEAICDLIQVHAEEHGLGPLEIIQTMTLVRLETIRTAIDSKLRYEADVERNELK